MSAIRPSPAGTYRRWAPLIACAAAAAGLLAPLSALPVAARAVLLAAFVFLGPGSAIAALVPMPDAALPIVVPAAGVTAIVLATWLAAYTWRLAALGTLAVLAGSTLAAGAAAWHRRGRQAARAAP